MNSDIDRTLRRERPRETSPARYLVRRSHSSQNPQYFSYPLASDPSGVREAFMPARDREVEESHAQSASRSTRGSAKIRASVVTALFFCVFFLRIVVVPEERRLVVVPDRARFACARDPRTGPRRDDFERRARRARARGAPAPTRVRFFCDARAP